MLICKYITRTRWWFVCSVITRSKKTTPSPKTATDPVQKLFVEKLREYVKRASDGKLVDPSPLILKEMKKELDKLEKQFGGGPGVDMTAFPTFKFDEAKVDPIDEEGPKLTSAKKKKGEAKKDTKGKK